MIPWRPGSLVPSNPLAHPAPETVSVVVVRDWHLREIGPIFGRPQPPLVRDDHTRWAGAVDELLAGTGEAVREVLREIVAYHLRKADFWPRGWRTPGDAYPHWKFHAAAAEVLTQACLAALGGRAAA